MLALACGSDGIWENRGPSSPALEESMVFSSLAGTLQATLLPPRQPTTPSQSHREHVLLLQSLSEHLENTRKGDHVLFQSIS